MAFPMRSLRLLALPFATLLIIFAATATSFSQVTTPTPPSDPNAPIREANALLTLQQCYSALGGDPHWQVHTSASVGGKVTVANVDHQISWADDWSGSSLKSRREYTIASGTVISTVDSTHGVRVWANGQSTQSDKARLTDLAPVHLPAVLLNKAISNASASIKTVLNTSRRFPNDQQVEVQIGSDRFSKQEWLINSASSLPDQITTYTSSSRHPDRPEALITRYVEFSSTQGTLIPSALETDLGALHLHVALTSVALDAPVTTTP